MHICRNNMAFLAQFVLLSLFSLSFSSSLVKVVWESFQKREFEVLQENLKLHGQTLKDSCREALEKLFVADSFVFFLNF